MGFWQMMTTQMGILFEGKAIAEILEKVSAVVFIWNVNLHETYLQKPHQRVKHPT